MVSLIFGHFFLGGEEDVFLAMYLDLDIGYYEVMQILDLEIRSSQNKIDVITLFQTSLFCPKIHRIFWIQKSPEIKRPPWPHIVWKLLKMSHLNYLILAFSTNFCPIKTDLSGNTVWPQASGFQKLAKMDHFWHF